jgi:hypothetical protein
MSSEWCQNKRCAEKKTQGQIRGKKGAKYYQSNKANWYGYWCSMGCREQWFNDNKDACIQAVGLIGKQVLPLDDAWYVEYNWGQYYYNSETEDSGYRNQGYYLVNKLKGVKQVITKQQAQTPEQIANDNNWYTINDEQARELATELGLAS